MRHNYSHLKAIGLLELLLVIALFGIIIIAVLRYYSSDETSSRINQTVQQYQTVKSAVANYVTDKPGTTGSVSIGLLVNKGYLPVSFVTDPTMAKGDATPSINAWGGTISANIVQQFVQITFTGMPAGACNIVSQRLLPTMNKNLSETTTPSCDDEDDASKNSVKAQYEL